MLFNRAILVNVQKFLDQNLGYYIVNEVNIIGFQESKKENYYIVSYLESMKLRELLMSSNKNSAYIGFMYKVFQTIFMSQQRKATNKDILKELRKVDHRFPETFSLKKS